MERANATGSVREGLDDTVEALARGVGDPATEVAQKVWQMTLERLGRFDHRTKAEIHSPGLPLAEEEVRGARVVHVPPEQAKLCFACPSSDGLQPVVPDSREPAQLRGQRLGFFEESELPHPLERVGVFRLESRVFGSSHLIDRLSEIHRVFDDGGMAILAVPDEDALGVARENASLPANHERRAAFGQHDHVRMFGDDLAAEVARYGFKVDMIDRGNFTADAVWRHRLVPNPTSHPLSANKRCVFFCRRRPRAASQSGHFTP